LLSKSAQAKRARLRRASWCFAFQQFFRAQQILPVLVADFRIF
jgi:hypothetical protein